MRKLRVKPKRHLMNLKWWCAHRWQYRRTLTSILKMTREAPVSSTDAVSVSTRVLTKNASTDASVFDALFGTENRIAGIRELVNEETYGIQLERRLPVEIIFGGQPNVGPNLDSQKEAIRLRKAFEKGHGITATPTPAIDPVEGTPVIVE